MNISQLELSAIQYIPDTLPDKYAHFILGRNQEVTNNISARSLPSADFLTPHTAQRSINFDFLVLTRPLTWDEVRTTFPHNPSLSGTSLHGAIVDHPAHHGKSILHRLHPQAQQGPEGYSHTFANDVTDFVLPGYTCTSLEQVADAVNKFARQNISSRIKHPAGSDRQGQLSTNNADQALDFVKHLALDLPTQGICIETHLNDIRTYGITHDASLGVSSLGLESNQYGDKFSGGVTEIIIPGDIDQLLPFYADDRYLTQAINQATKIRNAYRNHLGARLDRINIDVHIGEINGHTITGGADVALRTSGQSPAISGFFRQVIQTRQPYMAVTHLHYPPEGQTFTDFQLQHFQEHITDSGFRTALHLPQLSIIYGGAPISQCQQLQTKFQNLKTQLQNRQS